MLFQVIGIFGSSSSSSGSRFHHKHKPRPWQKRAHKMKQRRRSLAYHLVIKCCRRSGLLALNGLKILLPEWCKHLRWKRKNARSRKLYGEWNQHFFKPPSKISSTVLHNWCYGDRDYTQLPHLLRSLNGMQHLQEWKNQATAQSVVNRLNVFWCSLENNAEHCNYSTSFESVPLIWDTGASLGLIPYKADFFDYVEVNSPVRDVTKMNYVIGFGTVIYKFKNDKGEDVFLPCIAYHLPTADICLFCPQAYHQMHDYYSTINSKRVIKLLKENNIVIPIDSGPSNLPMVWDPSVSAEKQREIGQGFVSKLVFCNLPGMNSMFQVPTFNSTVNQVGKDSWEDVWDDLICPCVGSDQNINLSGPQRELLTWHWKLSVGMQRIQEMMRETNAIDNNGKEMILPPVIPPKSASTPSCPIPKCHSCE